MFKRNLKVCLTLIITMCIFPSIAKADCAYERVAELSRIAGNVKFSYDYEVNTNYANFNINILNVTNDIYVVDNYGVVFSGSSEFTKNYMADALIKYTIYSNDANCRGEELLTKYVNLPFYNKFSTSNICEENADYEQCGMWARTTGLTYEKLKDNIDNYNRVNQIEEKKEEKKGSWDIVVDILKQYYYVGIVILLLIILLVIKKKVRW